MNQTEKMTSKNLVKARIPTSQNPNTILNQKYEVNQNSVPKNSLHQYPQTTIKGIKFSRMGILVIYRKPNTENSSYHQNWIKELKNFFSKGSQNQVNYLESKLESPLHNIKTIVFSRNECPSKQSNRKKIENLSPSSTSQRTALRSKL